MVPIKTLEEMNQWKTQHRPTLPVEPDISNTSDLNLKMNSILKRDDLAESEKSRLYSETLQKFKLSHNKALEGTIVPHTNVTNQPDNEVHKQNINNDIIASVPKTLQNKATLLIERLKRDSTIKWDNKGVVEINGKTIKGSNIIDLVNDVIRERKTSQTPTGWSYFSSVLKNINIPQEYIGNKKRWMSMQKQLFDDDNDDGDDDSEFFDTSAYLPSTPLNQVDTPVSSKKGRKRKNKKEKQSWTPYH